MCFGTRLKSYDFVMIVLQLSQLRERTNQERQSGTFCKAHSSWRAASTPWKLRLFERLPSGLNNSYELWRVHELE